MKTLSEIYSQYTGPITYGYGDKGTTHSYINYYAELFEIHRLSAKNVLEIGAAKGHSLKMWKEYFQCARIFGIEIDKGLSKYRVDGTTLVIGDSTKKDILNHPDLVNISFDVIIDDGSHIVENQMVTLNNFINVLALGGIYIIEDFKITIRSMSILNEVISNLNVEHKILDLRQERPFNTRQYFNSN